MGWLVDPDLEVILDGIEGMSRATLEERLHETPDRIPFLDDGRDRVGGERGRGGMRGRGGCRGEEGGGHGRGDAGAGSILGHG